MNFPLFIDLVSDRREALALAARTTVLHLRRAFCRVRLCQVRLSYQGVYGTNRTDLRERNPLQFTALPNEHGGGADSICPCARANPAWLLTLHCVAAAGTGFGFSKPHGLNRHYGVWPAEMERISADLREPAHLCLHPDGRHTNRMRRRSSGPRPSSPVPSRSRLDGSGTAVNPVTSPNVSAPLPELLTS